MGATPTIDRAAALHEVARSFGGAPSGVSGTLYRFGDPDAADRAAAVLDALDPGCVGAVAGGGLLCLIPTGQVPR